MKFVDKSYRRLEAAKKFTPQAAVRIEQRDGRRIRRNPDHEALVQTERLLQAQPESLWAKKDGV